MNMDDRVVKVTVLRTVGEIRVGSIPTPCILLSECVYTLSERKNN